MTLQNTLQAFQAEYVGSIPITRSKNPIYTGT